MIENPELHARYLKFVQDTWDKKATEVIEVKPSGSTWNGDTEGGFYDTFHVHVKWKDSEGKERADATDADEAEALWKAVVW